MLQAAAGFGFRSSCTLAVGLTLLHAVAATHAFRITFLVENLMDRGSGNVTVEVHPEWAPIGAKRFSELVQEHFFDSVRFFRVIDGFMAQFGISGDPAVASKWRERSIRDEHECNQKNRRGHLTFATAGRDTRTTQIFVNFKDNLFLDAQGFCPFAKVVEGIDVVDKLYSGYGDGAPNGLGPDQERIQRGGNTYLEHNFPKLSFIRTAMVSEADLQTMSAAIVAAVESSVQQDSRKSSSVTFVGVFGVIGIGLVVLMRSNGWKWSSFGEVAKSRQEDSEGEELTLQASTHLSRKLGNPCE